jgi:hypothetical protein
MIKYDETYLLNNCILELPYSAVFSPKIMKNSTISYRDYLSVGIEIENHTFLYTKCDDVLKLCFLLGFNCYYFKKWLIKNGSMFNHNNSYNLLIDWTKEMQIKYESVLLELL